MEKITIQSRLDWEFFRSTLRIMRLITILIFLTTYTVSASTGYSQMVHLSINLKNAGIKEVISTIESQSDYIFLYKDDVLDQQNKVSINAIDETLDKIMSQICKELHIDYKINDRQVIVSVNYSVPLLSSVIQKKESRVQRQIGKGEIYGKVTEAENGKSLPYVSIIINGTTIGTTSNENGTYVLSGIPEGPQVIVYSFLGFEKMEKPVNIIPGKKLEVNAALKTIAILTSEVVITSQAKGQMKAINQQMNSKEIMNAVSAERIQEMPDANAAETVSRLPGVSLQREGGEGSKLVIRGLEPKYNRISIEGVTMLSTGGDDRSVDISMISPYSLDGIEVTKAITADKDANYMGGSVNFKLRKADPGIKSNVIVQGGYNNLRNKYNDFMFVGSIGNRFFSDKLGMYIQANIEKRNRSSNDLNAFIGHYRTPEINVNNVLTTGGLSMVDNYRNRDRYGATVVFDYKLPKGSIQLNNILSQSTTANNAFSEMYTSGRTHEYNTGDSKNKLLIVTNVLEYIQNFGKLEIMGKVSHSLSSNETPYDVSFHYVQGDGMSSDVYSKPISPEEIMNYKTINDQIAYLTSINSGYGLSKQSQLESELNLKYNFVITKKITGNVKGGGKLRRISNDFDYNDYSGVMNLGSGTTEKDAILNAFPWMQEIVPLGSSRLPYLLFMDKNANPDEFLGGEYTMGPYGDISLMNNVLEVLSNTVNNEAGISETYHYNDYLSSTSDYAGNEHLSAAYLMGEINFGSKLTFIPGFRFEKNVTQYTAPRGNSSLPFPDIKYVRVDTTMNISDQFLLPMIHLKYVPFKWLSVRLAYTHTLSRPNFNAITPRWDIGSTNITWNNFALKPELSKNWDLYFSFRQNKLGLLTIGGFTKDISDKIFAMDKRVILDPSEFGLPNSTKDRFIYTQMNNPQNAKVRGLELDWQTSLWYLPGALCGIVFNVNYTRIFSEAKYPRTIIESTWDPDTFEYAFKNIDDYYTAPLVFQPRDILNLSAGYEHKKFFSRLSMLYQKKVFQGPSFWPELVNYSDNYLRLDLSVKQGLPWYGIQVFCNLNNITNSRDILRNVGSGYVSSMQHYGRTIDLGIRWNFEQKKAINSTPK